MIFDSVEHIGIYKGIHIGLDRAIQMIESNQLDLSKSGKVSVDGDAIFYLVQDYSTKDVLDAKLEAHRRYIDLQFLVKGNEIMDCINIVNLSELTDYDEANDIQFFKGECNRLFAKENDFAVFFPHDGHRTGVSTQEAEQVKKVVFKIAYDL
jgi:YhcH/YjgK/YiaL family protein